jgi:hypothetical protein
VGRSPSDNRPQQVSGYNEVGVRAAYAFLGFTERIDPARPLKAVAAAYAQIAKTALGLLLFIPVPCRFNFFAGRFFQHLSRCGVNRLLTETSLYIVHFVASFSTFTWPFSIFTLHPSLSLRSLRLVLLRLYTSSFFIFTFFTLGTFLS